MKKDIEFPEVEGVQVAIARKPDNLGDFEWYVYLINKNTFDLQNVLITSKGYGSDEKGNPQKTSILRHLIEKVEAQDFAAIEKIDPAVFHLCSEYWVSYYVDTQIYDKKFIFMPDSIIEEHIFTIDMLNLEGILHN